VNAYPHRHLLGIETLAASDIEAILDAADGLREVLDRPIKKVPALRGKTVVNLFYEASTRTRASFEVAEKVLSADSLTITTAGSSVQKGETLLDTARNLEAMNPDMIVLRHASSGAPHFLARHCRSAIVNAGDGAHEHPTQALLDALTLRQRKKRLRGLRVAIVGDLLHSRVARSNVWLLTRMGADVVLCAPPTLVPPGIETLAPVTYRIDEAVEGADAVMMLRLQLERMTGGYIPSVREYHDRFGLTEERVRRAKKDVLILHPGPMNRGVEIASEVADGPYSVILDQVTNGVAIRMAVLYLLLGESAREPDPPPAPAAKRKRGRA
jgi:aspartate carbamoyltransferase catalytic subunit